MAQNRSRLTMLAGWLFADLFLVLLVAGLAALPAGSAAHTTRPSPSPVPAPTVTPTHRPGLSPHLLKFSIHMSPAGFRAGERNQFVAEVNHKLRHYDPNHRLVGFVLVFASDDEADIGRAVRTATAAFRVLRRQSPVFRDAQGLGYWNGSKNDFEFKVFLLN